MRNSKSYIPLAIAVIAVCAFIVFRLFGDIEVDKNLENGVPVTEVTVYDTYSTLKTSKPTQALPSESFDYFIQEDDPRIAALEATLPAFEDYPVATSPIPPKPLVDHKSNSDGMTYWTFTEEMASSTEIWDSEGRRWIPRTTYDMAGHYLVSRCCTFDPYAFIIDGLTGKIYVEEVGLDYDVRPNSLLLISNPFLYTCFNKDGDYNSDTEPYFCGTPQYVLWQGDHFKMICQPEVRGWKVVSCGKTSSGSFSRVK